MFMRQYVVDELRPDDYQKLKQHLNTNAVGSGMEGVINFVDTLFERLDIKT